MVVEASTLADRSVAGTKPARRVRALFWVAVALALVSAAYSAKQMPSDVRSYRGWINAGWPSWTTPGPYPVLVDAVWWPLRFVHAANVNPTWVLLWTVPATVVACLILWRTASRPYLAAAAWLFAAALLERSYWLRLEPVSAAIAVAGVAAAVRNRAALSAGALTVGALIKVWPAFLAPLALLVTAPRRWLRWLVVFAVPWVVYLVLLYARRPPGGTAWFTFTFSRPIQIESFSALGPMWAIGFGSRTWRIQFLHGLNSADLVIGPHLKVIHLGFEVLGVVALAVVAVRLWRARRDPGRPEGRRVLGVSLEQALLLQAIVLLVLIVAGPVFSPQYMAWFAPVFAVAAGEGLLGRETVLWVVCCGLTALDYPLGYDELRVANFPGLIALTARDIVFVALLAVCLRHFWQLTRPAAAAPYPAAHAS